MTSSGCPLLQQRIAEIGLSLCVGGIEPQRFAAFRGGFLRPPLPEQGKAEVVVGHRGGGIDPQSLAIFGNRFVCLLLLKQHIAEVIVELRIHRVDAQGFAGLGARFRLCRLCWIQRQARDYCGQPRYPPCIASVCVQSVMLSRQYEESLVAGGNHECAWNHHSRPSQRHAAARAIAQPMLRRHESAVTAMQSPICGR